ncbi:precorrin-2 C(20)-methyltransferase [Desertibacillus haloalkaliphilus]|uniref:precorrin-2 C(20)-methyltransferase n=1 Tax=Desertibacillus haloalkaliphilus TaxID=1328930 RepID=UPI001C277462|nr:precorrin-2 C(20)-methyltransferase [Desertibacillus haloalkaliphilus]MBU8907813.1 precorrin-2 C(20)-methyltransferase [Desertibacillus haloalkaliphilus]
MTLGTVYGVGVGPGDPELITVKAYRTMKESPVIAYPKKRKGSKSYAYQIVEEYIDQSKKKMLGLVFPMTKDQDVLDREWRTIVAEVWEYVKEGKDVAFVTEGDPMLYSTFIHLYRLMSELHPDVNVVSIPGISSINGVASRIGLPLADGDDWTAVIPATEDRERMKQALLDHDGIVFIKVAKVLPMMIELLEELDLLEKATVATKVTSKEEYIWREVKELRHAELEYLTLMMVRK